MVTLHNVISEDGYIATEDGREGFIPDKIWPLTLSLFKQYDALVFGRKTYESIQKYPLELLEPLGELNVRKVVVTKNKEFKPKTGYEIINDPKDILDLGNVIVSSGPTLNNYLMKNNLVDKIILRRVPVSIGKGIKPFNNIFNYDNMVFL
jgi:dihydrofolate reductase